MTIDRVLAARMRDATVLERNRLNRITIAEFRQMLEWQGHNVSRFNDQELNLFRAIQASYLQRISIQLLQADFLKSDTPIIISGNIKGAIGMVAKILGPTFVASLKPIGITIWWNCDKSCEIEAIVYSDGNVEQVINP